MLRKSSEMEKTTQIALSLILTILSDFASKPGNHGSRSWRSQEFLKDFGRMTRHTFFCNHFCLAGTFDLWFFVLSQANQPLSQQMHSKSCQTKIVSPKNLECWILNIFTEPKIQCCKFLIFITQNITVFYFACICCDRG